MKPARIFSVVFLAAVALFLLWQEPKTGCVEGVATQAENGRALAFAQVQLSSAAEGEFEHPTVTTKTDGRGRFTFRAVPVGRWQLSVYGEHHGAVEKVVEVAEAQTERVALALGRSQPDLNVAEARQPVFTSRETPFLPVQGYGEPGDKLTIAVSKTKLSAVLAQPGGSEQLSRMTATFEGAMPEFPAAVSASGPTPLATTTEKIARPDREGFFVQRLKLPISKVEPGIYFVKVTNGKKSVVSWALVTNTALVLKTPPQGEALAYVANLVTGEPVAGASISPLGGGRGAVTDKDGLARVSLSGVKRLVVTRGTDEATLQVSRSGSENSGGLVVHAWTDRTIYRPGHTVSWKAVLRQRDSQSSRAYAVPSGLPATVTVLDARGGEVSKKAMTASASGSLDGSFEISPESETGDFTLKIEADGETYAKDITVAAYRKPEFEASATPAKAAYVLGERAEFSVSAKYYFGAPVAGAKVTWQVYREGDWAAGMFEPGLWAELDSDETESLQGGYYGEKVADGAGVLDANGRLNISLPTPKKDGAPQVERFTLSATVTDAAKRTSDLEASVRVASGRVILSVEPEGFLGIPGKETHALVQATDLSGVPLPNIEIQLQPEYEKWDEKTEKTTRTPLGGPLSAKTGPDGRASVALTPTRAGSLRLTASARDAEGNSVEGSASLSVLGDDEPDWGGTTRGGLAILTDKRSYAPGETAQVLVSTATDGERVLLTVEGDAVHSSQVLRMKGRATRISLPIRAEWGPNVTLAACAVREKGMSQSQAPLRVSMPDRELSVKITPEKPAYEPGQKARFQIAVTDGAGKPVVCDLSFALVDEAIFALAADDPKDLRKAFYPRRSNAVETRASFEVAYLSGESKSDPSIAPRRKFLDTASWLPNVRTDAMGHATVETALPDNLTAWRATVRAVSGATAVGYGVGRITVSKPFFVRLELPRFLVQGDETRALALVHNETGAEQSVTLTLGDARQTLKVASGAVGKVAFPLSMETLHGERMVLKAWTDGEKFTDGVDVPLPQRPFARTLVVTKSGVGDDGSAKFTLDADPRALPDSLSLDLRVAPSVGSAIDDALGYLRDYPYGCTEQTTSRFWSQLVSGKADEKRVRDGLTRLRKLQHGSGVWGWWETDGDDPWLTGYALLALTDASKNGWAAQTKDTGLKATAVARKMLKVTPRPNNGEPESSRYRGPGGNPDSPIIGGQGVVSGAGRAMLAWALARAGQGGAVVDALRKLTSDEIAKASDTELALWTLAARDAGKQPGPVWPELQRRAVVSGGLISWRAGKREWDSSDRMATALGLKATLAMNPADTRVLSVVRALLVSRTGESFGSTRDTAFVVAALSDWLRLHPEPALVKSVPPTLAVNGNAVSLQAQPGGAWRARVPAKLLKPGANAVLLSGGDGLMLWSAALTQAVGKDPKTGAIEPVVPEGVIIDRDFLRDGDDRPQTSFKQGEGVRVRLTLTVPKELEYVLIEDAFPAGLEPTERGTAETTSDFSTWSEWYSSVDVRDDRIAVFARRLTAGKHVFTYHLRAQTPGKFGVLPASLAPMYVDGFQAQSRGGQIEVTE